MSFLPAQDNGNLLGLNQITSFVKGLITQIKKSKINIKNSWHDENDEVYIYFKREEMEQQLGISERTVLKVMLELKTFLLWRKRNKGLTSLIKFIFFRLLLVMMEIPPHI